MVNITEYKAEFNLNRMKWSELYCKYLPDTADYLIGVENYHLIKKVWLLECLTIGLSKNNKNVEYLTPILSKILVPDAFFPTLQNARLLTEKIPYNKETFDILELCTGAGISTMMTWLEIKKKFPMVKCCITSVDVSFEAVLLAETLLGFMEIPVLRIQDKNEIPTEFDGVILINGEAASVVGDFVRHSRDFDAIYSDHGIGYIGKEQHSRIIKDTNSLLKPGGTFFVNVLDEKVKISISKPKMLGNILFNSDLFTSIPDHNQPYDLQCMGDYVRVTGFNSKETAGVYKILQELLYGGKILDFINIKAIKESTTAQSTTVQEVKSPIRFTQELLEKSEISPTYDQRKHSVSRTLWYRK